MKVDAAPPQWAIDMLMGRVVARVRAETPPEDEPPVTLAGDALERWHGRLIGHRNADGSVARGLCLWDIGCDLEHAGATRRTVRAAVEERDGTLGWDKFNVRNDAEIRYDDIVTNVFVGQTPRVRLKKADAPSPVAPTEWLTAVDLSETEDEEVTWFAHGLLGGGLITELDGKAKQAGKTTLLLALTHAVLHGEEFLGQPTTYSPIVYLTEQSGPSFKRNLSRAGLLDRTDLHILLWNRVVGRKWGDIVQEARARAREVGARVLIVDTLAQFSGIRGDDENKSGAAMDTMEPLQAATTDGLAVLTSRHDRKSGGEVGDSGRGSSAFAGAVDIVLHLQRLPGDQGGKERQRMLDGISRFEETPDKLLIELEPGVEGSRSTYRAVGDVQVVKRESLRIDILASLPTNHDDAPEFEELRKDLGMREIEVRRVLNDLVREGLVEQFGRPRRYCQRVMRDDDL